ncbi:MAG: helix-turn-helix domain-containing protein [Ruminococcus flavefaciens]|nr:helix-turn-helix domain-containing protein [Ruminococcus flavefaciens]
MNYKEEFSKRLIRLREQKGLTQQQLADKLQITRQSLSLYEKAERTINIELFAKIADFFNVSTDYLMGRTDVTSMNEDIQTACKVTGLSEPVIEHIKDLSKFVEDGYFTSVLEQLILGLNHLILYSVEDYHVANYRASKYKNLLIKKYCECYNLNISDIEIEEKGIYAIKNLLQQAECKNELDLMFSEISDDIDYKKYKITKYIQDIFLSIDDYSFSEKIAEKANTIDNSQKTKPLDIMDMLLKEESNNAEHNPTSE